MAPSRASEVSNGRSNGAAASDGQPYWTFEFFPPKTFAGLRNLLERLERMAALHPTWVHITWGAGGSTQDRSLELAEAVRKLGLDVCLHLTCTNMETRLLDDTLRRAKDLGITRILALRGDEPRGEEYFVKVDSQFQHAIDLVKYIRRHHGDTFSLGVAGYPEGHDEPRNLAQEVAYLKEKVDAGADFVVTQLFYDVEGFLKWYRRCRAAGISAPILPGIMPIQNYQSFRRMTGLCKSLVPDDVHAALLPISNDDILVKDFGVQYAQETIRRLRAAQPEINGFNLCTLNLEKSVRRILDGLDWVPRAASMYTDLNATAITNGGPLPSKATKVNGATTPAEAPPNASANNLAPRLDAPATWDDFPNGRFGDARSPAYGDLDGWGVSLKLTPAEALQHWGRPTSNADVSAVFADYIRGAIPAIAWSDEPLRLESSIIVDDLTRLNVDRGWWTVGSQPAVDGAPSESRTYGFGPRCGYVYQKAFVEFFCPETEIDALARRAEETNKAADGRRVTYFAGGRTSGEFRTNMAPGEVNAVTWGVFPGQDLVTTTLIEEMSFKAWKEEAFSIWNEWERLYPASSPSRQLLKGIAEDRWLVSVVHHDYKDSRGLWRFLGLEPGQS